MEVFANSVVILQYSYFFLLLLPQVPVREYAEHCIKKLERISQTGARKGVKKISLEEINLAKVSMGTFSGENCDDQTVVLRNKMCFPS